MIRPLVSMHARRLVTTGNNTLTSTFDHHRSSRDTFAVERGSTRSLFHRTVIVGYAFLLQAQRGLCWAFAQDEGAMLSIEMHMALVCSTFI